jgi:hypothetical protein
MELTVLDTNFEAIYVVDTFKSLIWTERYDKNGDFELSTVADNLSLSVLRIDNYIKNSDCDSVMIIEDIQLNSDSDQGSTFYITGRSLESILDRRIVWKQTILNGNLQVQLEKLLDENIIDPEDANRKIDNFIFQYSDNLEIVDMTISAQFTGDDIYDVVSSICESFGLGFRIDLVEKNLVFSLYIGQDRSYDQFVNPYVVFSPSFENILSSNYLASKRNFKTVTLVAGEGEGVLRITIPVAITDDFGINRREDFTDARDVSSYTYGDPLTPEEYLDLLIQRGWGKLTEKNITESFEGQIDTYKTFKINEDFYLGDIVQLINEYGIEGRVRILEIIRSQDQNGMIVYPTFSNV